MVQFVFLFCLIGMSILPNPCQHLGGINVVERIMESLLNVGTEGDSYVAMLDLLGYDAWPAQYALIQSSAGWVPIHFWIWFNVFTRLLTILYDVLL